MKIIYGIVFTSILFFFIYKSGALEYFDFKLYDIISSLAKTSQHKKNSSVVIVDIDEKSLKYLGQWPWSRLILSKLIDNISRTNPANIGIDILFPEKDKTSILEVEKFFKNYFSKNLKISGVEKYLFDNDNFFAQTLAKNQVTMPVYLTNTKGKRCFIPKKNRQIYKSTETSYESPNMLCNLSELQKSAADIGFINAQKDKDGILRRVPMFIKYKNYNIPSFALANLINIDGIEIKNHTISILNRTFKTDKNSNILLNFNNKKYYKTISAINVLSNKFDKNEFLGKFIIIGTSAVGLHDDYMVSSGEIVPGVFIHATVIDNILNNKTIYQPQYLKFINFSISFLLSLILLILIYKRLYIRVLSLFIGASLFYLAAGFYFLKNFIYISVGYFLTPYFIFFFFANMIFILFYYKERKNFLEDLSKAHSETIDSMSLVVETRDAETGAHILRTKEYMRCLVDYLFTHDLYKNDLTKNYRELIYRATSLHDIGKVGIPDHILKKPSKLDKDEYEIMKQHSTIGRDIIENAMKNNKNNQFLKIAYNIAYYHHEKWDGSGYPCGIKKDEIPLEARMMALVDVYDALISKRCYKIPFSFEESEKMIVKGSGTHFDPILVGVFVELKQKFKEIAQEIR